MKLEGKRELDVAASACPACRQLLADDPAAFGRGFTCVPAGAAVRNYRARLLRRLPRRKKP